MLLFLLGGHVGPPRLVVGWLVVGSRRQAGVASRVAASAASWLSTIVNALNDGICLYFQAPLSKTDKSWYVEGYNHARTSRAKVRFDKKPTADEIEAAVEQVLSEITGPAQVATTEQSDWVEQSDCADDLV